MNLIEIQSELKDVEKQISQINLKIEKMKSKPEEEKKNNFALISKMAKRHPIKRITITTAPEWVKKKFIGGLAYLILTEDSKISARLLYLCRISIGCGIELSAEDIYKAGLEFEIGDIEELEDYKYSFLVEALIIANMTETEYVSFNMFGLIADIANILVCDKEEIRVLAQVAKSVLVGNTDLMDDIPLPSNHQWYGRFNDYIPKEWIVSKRKLYGVLCMDRYKHYYTKRGLMYKITYSLDELQNEFIEEHPCVIKNKIESGNPVKKGDVICVYEEIISSNEDESFLGPNSPRRERKEVVAEENGIVILTEVEKRGEVLDKNDKYLGITMISFYDDIEWEKVLDI